MQNLIRSPESVLFIELDNFFGLKQLYKMSAHNGTVAEAYHLFAVVFGVEIESVLRR